MNNARWIAASRMGLGHLGAVLLVLLAVAALLWGLWYPPPLDQLAHGREL